jgi:Mg/Co/Ni transporter MgtE
MVASGSRRGARAAAMGFFEEEIARAVVLALFVPLICTALIGC